MIPYSLKIWQMPFLEPDIYGGKAEWFLAFPADLVIVVLAALASYYILEKPVAGLRRRYRVHRETGGARVEMACGASAGR